MTNRENIRRVINILFTLSFIISVISGVLSGNVLGNVLDKEIQLGGYDGGGSGVGTGSGTGDNPIGISAYVKTGSYIDIQNVKNIFNTIKYEDRDAILGTYYLSTGYTGEDVYLYITSDGYIIAFYTSDQPASRIIAWTSSTTIASKFAGVIQDVGRYLGYNVDYRDIQYYDFRYPDANRILIATKSAAEVTYDNYGNSFIYNNFKFNIPSNANVYEISYSMYLSSYVSPSNSNTAIDTNQVGGITGRSGSITTQYGSYSGYVSQGQDHLFGIIGNYGDEAAGALVVIYKDPSITVKGPDYYWDGILEYAGKDVGQTGGGGYIEPTPTPTIISRPTPRMTIPVPIPTESEGEEIGAPTPTSIPPDPDTSINLYGERTDVELGQDILLKLSAVNYIFKKEPLHAQIILIPPSGMSVYTSDSASGTSQYVSNFDLEPGGNNQVQLTIKSNQEGNFKVTGRIAYYFGDDKDKGVVKDLNLPIKVRPASGTSGKAATVPTSRNDGQKQTDKTETASKKKLPVPGFEIMFSIMTILSLTIILKRRYI